MKDYRTDVDRLTTEMVKTRAEAENWLGDRSELAVQDFETRRRFSVLTALLLWAAEQPDDPELERRPVKDQARAVVAEMKGKEKEIVEMKI